MRKILLLVTLFALTLSSFAQQKDAKYYYDNAMKQSDLKKVIENFSKAIQLQPTYADALYYRGVAYFHDKQTDKALADFNSVLQLKPKYPGALAYRGRVKEMRNKDTEALADYNAALAIDGKYNEGLYFRGLYYKNHKNAAKACADFKDAKKNGYPVPDADMSGCNSKKQSLDKK